MMSKTLLATGVLALLALAVIYQGQRSLDLGVLPGSRESLQATGLAPAATQKPLGSGDEETLAGAGERVALASDPQALAASEPRLRVIDQAGAPIAQAVVAWANRESVAQRVTLDEQGCAVLPEGSSESRFWARAPGFADGFSPAAERAGGPGVTLVLEPARSLRGVLIVDGEWPSKPERLRSHPYQSELGLDGFESQLQAQLVLFGAISEDSVTITEVDGNFVLSGLRPGVAGRVQMSRGLLLSNEAGAPVRQL